MGNVPVLVWILTGTMIALVLAFIVFAYQKWLERDEIKQERADIREERIAIGAILKEVRELLATVKGWAAVNKSTSDRAVVEVKEEVQKVPDATAQKVANIIASGDSAKLARDAEGRIVPKE